MGWRHLGGVLKPMVFIHQILSRGLSSWIPIKPWQASIK